MKRLEWLLSGKLNIVLSLMVFIYAGFAYAQKPGAHLWGDADGNGIIESPDISTLVTILGDPGADDTLAYQGHPQSRFRQELDGNGLIEVPDYSILLGWVTGDFSSRPGNPDQLALDGDTHLNLNLGDSVTLSAYALSPAAAGSKVRTGLGVIFKIDPSGTCTTAQINGYNVAGGLTVDVWRDNAAYHYTPKPGVPDNGRATVRVNTNGCSAGQTIKVEVYIPDDVEAGVVPGRFPDDLPASSKFTVSVISGGGCQQVTLIELTPESAEISEGETVRFSAYCTLADFSQVDCTSSYCGTSTEWYKTGHLIKLDPPNLFQGMQYGGTGTVTGLFDDNINPSVADSALVTVYDLYPPDTFIDSGPPDLSNSADAVFSFSCDKPVCSFECNLDFAGWEDCVSPYQYLGLLDGEHFFQVRAFDTLRVDPTPAEYTWEIDTIPPITEITFHPPYITSLTSAAFEFLCNEDNCTFQCQLDSGLWSLCSSPQLYEGLSDGPHQFSVRAIDQAGNIDPNPPSFSWQIDNDPPDTFITSAPPNPSSTAYTSFSFNCNEPGCGYECKMDMAEWSACSSPKNYVGLINGTHTFQVRAIDRAGNIDPDPATYTWKIKDYTPPDTTITYNPPDPTKIMNALFLFIANEPGCTFECKLDSGLWETCSSPKRYYRLTNGTHSFRVRATDSSYLVDQTPATYSWTINRGDYWIPTTATPSARSGHTAVWTGTEMIIWGGDANGFTNTGGRYNPVTDSWSATTTDNAPDGRYIHTVVWTGTEMIVWGGGYGYNTGGRYNPATDSWAATTTGNAPSERYYHTAVWTGNEMIVWGGCGGSYLNTGGMYNPTTDFWTRTTITNAPSERENHTAVWTGTEMIIWGGYDYYGYTNTGGRYNPTTNSWNATSTTNAPSERVFHTAVWTGTEMIVWGGACGYNTGGRYNPATDSWASTTTTNAPSERYCHTAVWTGDEMIVWGGSGDNTGGRYNPATDSWASTTTTNAPSERYYHTAVWTGTEMIVWGGEIYNNYETDTGGRYNPVNNTWVDTSHSPSSRYNHTTIWTGSEMIVWGGDNGTGTGYNNGGRYNPLTDSWTSTTTVDAPEGRYSHTAVWSGIEMIVWGGGYNTGGRYNPSTDSWNETSIVNAPSVRIRHTAVWTENEMVVWGGYDGSYINTGGRYNPSTNSWAETTTTDAPEGREYHTAVWTGNEMIIWGGLDDDGYINTGGRYNSTTDTWATTETYNAPEARDSHTAVWTGAEMIIWGGMDNYGYANTGGRYDPLTDSWTETTISDAPDGRYNHTAVWTGTEMIVWGGGYNTGGRYDPLTDSWTETTLTDAPEARSSHTAVWTGNEMIIWGGEDGNYFNSGGRYVP